MSRTKEIREFVVQNVSEHPGSIIAQTCAHFGVSRTSVLRQMNHLIQANVIKAVGNTSARRYSIRPRFFIGKELNLIGLREHVAWNQLFRDKLPIPKNVDGICDYGFHEMVNNAIDHSEGSTLFVRCICNPVFIQMHIQDNGIGIFKKVRNALGLAMEEEAILELSKGKFTTDPKNHSGEGIFFTSRMFDKFEIHSGNLCFHHVRENDDWIVESSTTIKGTLVVLNMRLSSTTTAKEVFDKFSGVDSGFTETRVPVALAKFGDENLVSRSQARRLLDRFDRFRRVVLDFEGVESIGQGFADQIFRVFHAENPTVEIKCVRANEAVISMIKHVQINLKAPKIVIAEGAVDMPPNVTTTGDLDTPEITAWF